MGAASRPSTVPELQPVSEGLLVGALAELVRLSVPHLFPVYSVQWSRTSTQSRKRCDVSER